MVMLLQWRETRWGLDPRPVIIPRPSTRVKVLTDALKRETLIRTLQSTVQQQKQQQQRERERKREREILVFSCSKVEFMFLWMKFARCERVYVLLYSDGATGTGSAARALV